MNVWNASCRSRYERISSCIFATSNRSKYQTTPAATTPMTTAINAVCFQLDMTSGKVVFEVRHKHVVWVAVTGVCVV